MHRKLIVATILLHLLILPIFANLAGADSVAPTAQWDKTFGYFCAYGIAQTHDRNLFGIPPLCDRIRPEVRLLPLWGRAFS